MDSLTDLNVIFYKEPSLKIDLSNASPKQLNSHGIQEIVPVQMNKEFVSVEGDDLWVCYNTKDIHSVYTFSRNLEVRMLIYTEDIPAAPSHKVTVSDNPPL